MKSLIILVSLVFLRHLIPGQKVVETCLFGRSTNGVGNFTLEKCNLRSKYFSCESRIARHGGIHYIERKCKQAIACRNNEKINSIHCYSEDILPFANRVCYFCCATSNCNNFDNITQLTTTASP